MAIRPTFYGFEMARTALAASQRSIDATGQNIANMNTEGYSRQRVNLSAVGAGGLEWKYPVHPSENVGLGVNIDSITRIRDEFLDIRYRKEYGDNQRFGIIQDVLGQVETLVDEFVTENLDHIFTSLMNAFQNFQFNADEAEFASLVRTASLQLTRTLNKIAEDIDVIVKNTYDQLELVKNNINSISRALDDVNREIRMQYLLGPVSNELLDKRDLLLDQLSGYGEVKVVQDETFGIWVYFGELNEAEPLDEYNSNLLVWGNQAGHSTFDFDHSEYPARLTWSEQSNNYNRDLAVTTGQVFAYYEMLNGTGNVAFLESEPDIATKGIPYYMNIINDFTKEFAGVFNDINGLGGGNDLFVSKDGSDPITARNITLAVDWIENARAMITTTNPDATGAARNDNILRFIDAIRSERTMPDGYYGSFQQYVGTLNSEIALEVRYNDDRKARSDILLLSIDEFRESIMGVSEDEEAMNLVKFQKSYNAAARYMTVLDEMLDIIINRLGIVGR